MCMLQPFRSRNSFPHLLIKELMIEMGVEEEKFMLETKAMSTIENAIFVMEMIGTEIEAGKGKVKLIIVTSAYHLPFSAWCFRQVAAAKKLALEMETVAATEVKPEKTLDFGWMIRLIRNNRMRKKLEDNDVELCEDFQLESIENVVQETEQAQLLY